MIRISSKDFGALKSKHGIHWWKRGIGEHSSKEEVKKAFSFIKERILEIRR